MTSAEAIIEQCNNLHRDLGLDSVQAWKEANPGKKAVGYMPVWVPREVIWAAGALPVGIVGGGDQVEIIRGDAYFQSYICHIPRSTIEMGLNGKLDALDGMVFPSICDVIRNLSGMWKLLFPNKLSMYFDYPQDFSSEVGGDFMVHQLKDLAGRVSALTGIPVRDDDLVEAIALYNRNRALVEELFALRTAEPERAPTSEVFLLLRAGNLLPPAEHSKLLEDYLAAARQREVHTLDNIRVVVWGSFCEQPPLALIRTLELAGCFVVDDDWMLVQRWIQGPIETDGDPWRAMARAFLERSTFASARYDVDAPKHDGIIRRVRERRADGVLLLAPSFCDPALLDKPLIEQKLDEAGIPSMHVLYSENLGQFGPIREQAGTFSDSVKLWSHA
jgi:benzoyl-CoA reductase subunit C